LLKKHKETKHFCFADQQIPVMNHVHLDLNLAQKKEKEVIISLRVSLKEMLSKSKKNMLTKSIHISNAATHLKMRRVPHHESDV
jgi:hypothetical protein